MRKPLTHRIDKASHPSTPKIRLYRPTPPHQRHANCGFQPPKNSSNRVVFHHITGIPGQVTVNPFSPSDFLPNVTCPFPVGSLKTQNIGCNPLLTKGGPSLTRMGVASASLETVEVVLHRDRHRQWVLHVEVWLFSVG